MATKPPAKPAAAAKEETPAAAPPKSKKMLIIGIILLLVLVAGGAGWYFTRGHAEADAHAEKAKVEVPQEAKFVPLGENFTVNLQREEGDQYLQAGITLKVLQPELEEKIKAMMPEIRSRLLFLLSSKKPSELQTIEGKNKLISEIIATTNTVLGIAAPAPTAPTPEGAASGAASAAVASAPVAAPNPKGVVDVLFTSFIIQ
jgi:flagellar protein FliL